ncbi:hypothetical protein [Streptacidiphilus sp. EB129]|uniref:hypothetical protein n=1 Tax=Streptacidiphilus sp. EB129 TaxID=3156262 RepID=UPI003517AB4D
MTTPGDHRAKPSGPVRRRTARTFALVGLLAVTATGATWAEVHYAGRTPIDPPATADGASQDSAGLYGANAVSGAGGVSALQIRLDAVLPLTVTAPGSPTSPDGYQGSRYAAAYGDGGCGSAFDQPVAPTPTTQPSASSQPSASAQPSQSGQSAGAGQPAATGQATPSGQTAAPGQASVASGSGTASAATVSGNQQPAGAAQSELAALAAATVDCSSYLTADYVRQTDHAVYSSVTVLNYRSAAAAAQAAARISSGQALAMVHFRQPDKGMPQLVLTPRANGAASTQLDVRVTPVGESVVIVQSAFADGTPVATELDTPDWFLSYTAGNTLAWDPSLPTS